MITKLPFRSLSLPLPGQFQKAKTLLCIFFAIATLKLSAQVPTLSYQATVSLTAGSNITPVTPTSSGVGAPGFSSAFTPLLGGLNMPEGLAVDAAGDIYVAETGNNLVKEFPATGGGAIIIGSGFKYPTDVKIDDAGDVYVADSGNGAVKEIMAGTGVIKTVGSGFQSITTIALDASGNIYVVYNSFDLEPFSNLTRISATDGSMTNLAGGDNTLVSSVGVDNAGNVFYVEDAELYELKPIGGPARLVTYSPFIVHAGLCTVDATGNVYVTDSPVKVFSAGSTTGYNLSDTLSSAYGIATDAANNLYITDYKAGSIFKTQPTGGYFISPGLPAGLSFNNITGVISGAPLVASPLTSYTITAYNTAGKTSATIDISTNLPPLPVLSYAGPQNYSIHAPITPLSPIASGVSPLNYSNIPVVIASGLYYPQGSAVDKAGNVYVADFAITKIPVVGGAPVKFGSGYSGPVGLVFDAAGNLYIADVVNNTVEEIKVGTTTAISIGSGFSSPDGVAVDAAGNVYVSDNKHNQVKEIPGGLGTPIVLASISQPGPIAIDSRGNIYVVSNNSFSVKKIPAGGGTPVTVTTGVTYPVAIAIDAADNLYSTDEKQVVELLAGTNTVIEIGSGYDFTNGLSVDGFGNVFVSDYYTGEVKQVTPVGGYFINKALPAGLNLSPSTGVISGIPTTGSPAQDYTITGYNIAGGTKATVNIAVDTSTAADLSALTISNGTLAPVFNRDSVNYNVLVPGTVNSIALTPATLRSTSTITVNGVAVASGTASQPIALAEGLNTINIQVTAQNGTTSRLYAVTVNRVSTPSTLSALTIDKGTLSPAFAFATTAYSDTVAYGTTSVTVTPTATDPSSVITVNGITVTSGAASPAIPVSGASSEIGVVVNSADGTATKTYTVTVIRSAPSANDKLAGLSTSNGTLSPVFSAGTNSYTVNVGNTLTTMTLTPTTTDMNATVTVNGAPVQSGSPSAYLPLAVGPNTVNVVVTAEDGVHTQTYSLVINKARSQNADLSSITLSSGTVSPVFVPATTGYTAIVNNSVSSITLTPTVYASTSVVTVNGIPAASGSPSSNIPLTVGTNTITITVTAPKGTTKTYTISVTRLSNVNVLLSSLTASNGVLIPDFSSGQTIYNVNVGNLLTTMTLTPTSADPAATITVNGSAVTSGSPSSFLPLTVGQNTYNVVVTGSDGTTTLTYTVIVHESKSENNYLSSLTTSSGIAQGLTVPETITQNVRNETNTITVTPTVRDLTSTITVNGTAVISGSPSGDIALNVGTNTITTIVTSQDTRTRTYTLTIIRAADATLSDLQISKGTLNTPFSPERTAYSAAVAYGVPFSVTPTAAGPGATITVNGTTVASGAAYPVTLSSGENNIDIIVTGSDGIAMHTYSLLVNGARSNNPDLFSVKTSSGIKQGRTVPGLLMQTVSNGTLTTSVTATAIEAATTITVNGNTEESGSSSGDIPLAAGDTTAITIITTAQTGASKTYTLKIFRLATVSNNNVYQPVGVEKPTETPLLAEDGITVHLGISPNGDGIDDFLQIDNIVAYPDNKLSIMNRNGQMVYEAKGYDNATKVFDGHSNKTGQMQLPGTYFYSLDYTVKGILKHKTGFLVLKY